MEQYYLIENGEKRGPFDLISLIMRIRTGRLQATDMVMAEGMDKPVVANHIKALHEVFIELEYAKGEEPKAGSDAISIDLVGMLRQSWESFNDLRRSSIVVMAGLLPILLIGAVIASALPIVVTVLLTSALSGAGLFAFTVYLPTVGLQRLDMQSFQHLLLSARGAQLLLAGAAMAMMLIGLPLLSWSILGPFALVVLLFGLLFLAVFLFAPLLWLDDQQNQPITAHLMQSARWVMSQDGDSISKILCIPALNSLGIALFVFPLAISLPITMHAWAALYEQHFPRQ